MRLLLALASVAHAQPGGSSVTTPAAAPPPAPPPLETTHDLLDPPADAMVLDALRWAGLEPADLHGGRESTNLGLAQPADPWRLPSAESALWDPLWLPQLVGDRSEALTRDLDDPLPTWTGVRRLARAELGADDDAGNCIRGPDRTLLEEAEASGRLVHHQLAYLRREISPRLDAVAGELLAEARWTRCRVDAALAPLPAEERHWLAQELERSLLEEEDDSIEGGEAERRERALRRAEDWGAVDRARLLAAGLDWADAVRQATIHLDALPQTAWPGGPLVVPTELGEVWLGSTWDDLLQGDPVLLLDPGGDDQWRFDTAQALAEVHPRPVAAWVDLDGDDLWTGDAAGPGGALFGVSAGVDLRGDDTWRTGPLAQGAAWFGVATFVDGAGQDVRVGPAGVQAFAGHGLAVLRDAGQDQDSWRAGAWAQAAALTGGLALLHDGGGSDRYVLGGLHEDSPNRLPGHYSAYGQGFAIGARPWVGGGLAWLQDDGGHDVYAGGLWVQGSSYWHSLGVLLDRAGNDVYTSDQYSQGSGIHLSAAGLFDLDGDDRYLTRFLGQGSGHDESVSWLLDRAGDDRYIGEDTVQGSSLTNAVSIFLDQGGDDSYAAASAKRWGFTNRAREHGAVALFVDLQGADLYLGSQADAPPPPTGEGGHGVALDLAPRVLGEEVEAPAHDEQAPPSGPPPSTAEQARALLLANTRWLAPAADTRAAVDLLFQAGPQAVGWLLPLTSSELHLRSYTVEAVIKHWAGTEDAAGRAEVVHLVVDSAQRWPQDAGDGSLRWHLKWIGLLTQDQPTLRGEAVGLADLGLRHPAWSVRRAAWHLARDLAQADALPRIMGGTWRRAALEAVEQETIPQVRAAAVRFLGADGRAEAVPVLVGALHAGGLEGRDAAEAALFSLVAAGHGAEVLDALRLDAAGAVGPTRDAALRLVGATGLPAALPALGAALDDPDPRIRRAALQGLLAHDSRQARSLVERHRQREADPRVLDLLEP